MRKGSGEVYYQISIRFTPEQSEEIQKSADANGRSFSKEVTKMIEAHLAQTKKESAQTLSK